LRWSASAGGTAICFGISDRRDHGFGCFAGRAKIPLFTAEADIAFLSMCRRLLMYEVHPPSITCRK
jgi:hypothetical protein